MTASEKIIYSFRKGISFMQEIDKYLLRLGKCLIRWVKKMDDKEEVDLIELDDSEKKALFEAFGFGVNDDGFVVNSETNKPEICPYSGEAVEFEKAALLPGSTLVMNATAENIAEYLVEHPKFRLKG